MPERIYAGSPAQEFYDLAKLYVKHHGMEGKDGPIHEARLDRLMIYTRANSNWLQVEYLPPCAAQYEIVWSNQGGFAVEDWHRHLESLRRALILERLADIDE